MEAHGQSVHCFPPPHSRSRTGRLLRTHSTMVPSPRIMLGTMLLAAALVLLALLGPPLVCAQPMQLQWALMEHDAVTAADAASSPTTAIAAPWPSVYSDDAARAQLWNAYVGSSEERRRIDGLQVLSRVFAAPSLSSEQLHFPTEESSTAAPSPALQRFRRQLDQVDALQRLGRKKWLMTEESWAVHLRRERRALAHRWAKLNSGEQLQEWCEYERVMAFDDTDATPSLVEPNEMEAQEAAAAEEELTAPRASIDLKARAALARFGRAADAATLLKLAMELHPEAFSWSPVVSAWAARQASQLQEELDSATQSAREAGVNEALLRLQLALSLHRATGIIAPPPNGGSTSSQRQARLQAEQLARARHIFFVELDEQQRDLARPWLLARLGPEVLAGEGAAVKRRQRSCAQLTAQLQQKWHRLANESSLPHVGVSASVKHTHQHKSLEFNHVVGTTLLLRSEGEDDVRAASTVPCCLDTDPLCIGKDRCTPGQQCCLRVASRPELGGLCYPPSHFACVPCALPPRYRTLYGSGQQQCVEPLPALPVARRAPLQTKK